MRNDFIHPTTEELCFIVSICALRIKERGGSSHEGFWLKFDSPKFKVIPLLWDLSPAAIGNQDAVSRNLGPTFLTDDLSVLPRNPAFHWLIDSQLLVTHVFFHCPSDMATAAASDHAKSPTNVVVSLFRASRAAAPRTYFAYMAYATSRRNVPFRARAPIASCNMDVRIAGQCRRVRLTTVPVKKKKLVKISAFYLPIVALSEYSVLSRCQIVELKASKKRSVNLWISSRPRSVYTIYRGWPIVVNWPTLSTARTRWVLGKIQSEEMRQALRINWNNNRASGCSYEGQ